MEKKRVIISSPITIDGTTLIPVVKSSLNCQSSGNTIFFSGIKQPVSIVVASPSAKKAFEITGKEIPLDQLIQEVPDLVRILKSA
ncbi:MAG: hypothetical protein JXB43_00820 [Dehalococcoidia bacterium]|nr:hypothetical protein [Dehalococcoidia bacterium]